MTDAPDANLKLGKLAVKPLLGLPVLGDYTGKLTPPPISANYSDKLKTLGPMLNREIGDCTCAAVGHAIQTWTSQTEPSEVILPDSVIQALYEKFGYVPGDAMTDNGAAATDVLKYWYGNPVQGHKLSAFASVRPGNSSDVKTAIWLFGVCYVGVQLPLTAQSGIWDVAPGASTLTGNSAAGSWGGHAIPVIEYDETSLTCISWGKLIKMSWNFWNSYCDESYALLSPDWIEKCGKSPSGQTLGDLTEDMQAFRQRVAIAMADDMMDMAA